MSRKNRFFKASRSIPAEQGGQSVLRSMSDLYYQPSQGGTTVGLSSLITELTLGGETASVCATETVTVQSETKSSPNLRRGNYSYDIARTQCCGQYTLNGFQNRNQNEPEEILFGIEETFDNGRKAFSREYEANEASRMAWYATHPDERYAWVPPHPSYASRTTKAPGMLVFTWNSSGETGEIRGRRFAKFIEDNKLGTCTFTPYVLNPNSGMNIQCMIWCVDNKAYKAYMKDHYDYSG